MSGLLLAKGGVLLLGLILMALAAWRGWRPALAVTLPVAAALRVAMLALSQDFEPYDLVVDFHQAGVNFLAHRDPILYAARPTGWSYLPLYAAYLGGAVWLEQHLGVPWLVIARIGPILFDLGVAVLVGRLAGPRDGALRRFQYACLPLAIMVSAVHGQMEPLCLLFALGAFLLVRGRPTPRRLLGAGALLGLAIATKSWPVLFLPVLLLALPDWRRRGWLAAGALGVPGVLFVELPLLVGTPLRELPHVAKVMLTYSPNVGTWGWTAVLLELRPAHAGQPDLVRQVWDDPFYTTARRVGSLVTLAVVAGTLWWWRRAHPVDLAAAATTAFQVVTAAHGMQYLLWVAPFSTARPTRWTWLATGVITVYAAAGYLAVTHWIPHYYAVSLVVIAALLVAAPWRRRTAPAMSPPAAAGTVSHVPA